MMRARAWAMTGTDDGKGERWRALQNRVIRERRMKENTHSQNGAGVKGATVASQVTRKERVKEADCV